MKKWFFGMFAAAAMIATAEYQFVEIRGSASSISGEIVAFDVQSTNDTQSASLYRVRNIIAYTNALDIANITVTNQVYFTETNGVMGVSNVIANVTVTNGLKKIISERNCTTGTIVSVSCVGGFATTNVNGWILKDDIVAVDCADKSAKTTIIIKK